MNILFIHHALTLGGIETLIVKLCKKLQEQGHVVYLIVEPGGHSSLTGVIGNYAKVIEVKSLYSLFVNYSRFKKLPIERIYCFGPLQMIIGLWLKQRIYPSSRVLIGTYHPREYYSTRNPKPHLQRVIEELVNYFPDQNILFMNSACKEQHAKALGRDFAQASIIPIPVDFEQSSPKAKGLIKKIVSIGRIVNFKRYNFAMIGVMEELKAGGYDFEYHIYGDGEEFAELAEAVKASPVRQHIYLHGPLDYAKLPQILQESFLYVGMGTTVVEAASLGVPALIAIESEAKALTYGLFGQTDASNLGEKSDTLTKYSLAEKIIAIDALDAAAYELLSRQSLEASKAFHIDEVVQQYSEFYRNASEFKLPAMHWILIKMVIFNLLRYVKKIFGFGDPLSNRYLDHSSKTYE